MEWNGGDKSLGQGRIDREEFDTAGINKILKNEFAIKESNKMVGEEYEIWERFLKR